ncbi:prophage CP4-57 regulatory family protein [Escherichia coli P0299917.7]|nr:prophage CP4-57 regulatory family protein [Escherichia coli P0299917.7]
MIELLAVSRTTLWRWVNEGIFPEPRKIQGRTLGWTASQYEEWLSKSH